ncbi:MAG: 3-deoxy-D-manno-octulosonic acid transferase [Kiritimatiellia bacterium]|nr:3-deoxy-D-manno-octulosonic acid transferase [Kiritimatiellia bacterium]
MERIIWFFYNFLFAIGYFFILPRFLLRMWRRGGYRRGFLQRFGIYDRAVKDKLAMAPGRFLIHAVSVGEIQVALMFMAGLRAKRPDSIFVLTTTTSTAHALAEKMMSKDDVLLYFPVDFPFIIRSVLRKINPLGLILVESELWPNLVRQAAARQTPIMLLNGRISNRSFRGYKLLRPLVQRVLAHFTFFCAQSAEDAGRLIELGAEPGCVRVTGSAKYDIADAPFRAEEQFVRNLQALGFGAENLLLVGGSTWPGEEAALLEIFARLRGQHQNLRLVLVPRHAERRKQVMAEITRSGLGFKLWSECRAAAVVGNGPRKDVLLVDTTGELRAFYAVAAIVFIGKSLTARGGQNPIEAAVCSKPIVVGPHMENFSGVMADFLESQAIVQVGDKEALEKIVSGLLGNEKERELIGGRAGRVVREKSGALRASITLFLNYLSVPKKLTGGKFFNI